MAVMEDAVARGKKKQVLRLPFTSFRVAQDDGCFWGRAGVEKRVLRLPFTLFRIAQDDGLWGDAQDDGCFGGR